MLNAHVRPSRDLRNNYSEIAAIVSNRDHVIITNNGRGEAVLIGIEDYAKYEEFLHHQYIAEKLAEAESQLSDPAVIRAKHNDVWKPYREKYGI